MENTNNNVENQTQVNQMEDKQVVTSESNTQLNQKIDRLTNLLNDDKVSENEKQRIAIQKETYEKARQYDDLIKTNDSLNQRLSALEESQNISMQNIEKQNLINRGVNPEQVEAVLQATSNLQGEQKDIIINQFANQVPNTTSSVQEQQQVTVRSAEDVAKDLFNSLL